MVGIEQLCEIYISEWPARPKNFVELVRQGRAVLSASKPDIEFLENALSDPRKRWFIASLFAKAPVPRKLLPSMVETAVNVGNPSTNRQFIQPCVNSLGALAVLRALRKTLETGNEEQQTGAVDALYWVNENPRKEDVTEELSQIHAMLISLFLETNFVPLQRSIISKIKPSHAESEEQFGQVIKLARNHKDEYIRHRIEIQLGNAGGPYQPLPARSSE